MNHIKYLTLIAKKIYEDKTNEKIKNIDDFDLAIALDFLGCQMECSDIYNDSDKLNAAIYRVNNGSKYDFKFVVDEGISKDLKLTSSNGNLNYKNWNSFIMQLFYYVISHHNEIVKLQDGDLVYENYDYVKSEKIKKLNKSAN